MSKITGVILAAGKGVRLLPFTQQFPKPILPICNKPLLYYQIDAMKKAGIEDIIIVIGHLGYHIVSSIGNGNDFGVRIKYVEQEQTLGIAHAVYKLESELNGSFLLFLGDIFFDTSNIEMMIACLENKDISCVLATTTEENSDIISLNYSVLLNEEGYVKRVIEKPRYVTNNLKGCGIYLFTLDVFDALRRTPRTAMRDEYELTDAIQILIDDGKKVIYQNIINEDINLTYPEDLLYCNIKALSLSKNAYVIGDGTELHPDSVISNSAIGNNVMIDHKVIVTNSVIFNDVTIPSDVSEIENSIITPYQKITCRKRGRG